MTSGDSDSVLLVGPSAPATQRLPAVGVGDLADDPRRGEVDLADQMLGAVIGLADPVGVEGVGGEDVGAGVGEALRDLADQLGPGQVQEVVIALLVAAEVERAAIIGLAEPARLDLRCRRRRP